MPRSYAEATPEERAALDVAREKIAAGIREYVSLLRDDEFEGDNPYVQEWIVGVEWTNVELERENKGARDVIARDGATLSAALGLGIYIRDRFGGS